MHYILQFARYTNIFYELLRDVSVCFPVIMHQVVPLISFDQDTALGVSVFIYSIISVEDYIFMLWEDLKMRLCLNNPACFD